MNNLSKTQLQRLAAFRIQKRCDEAHLFVVEGVKLCQEALASAFTVRTLCATADWYLSQGLTDEALGLRRHCDAFTVTAEQLERLSLMRTPNKVWMLVCRPQPAVPVPPENDLTLVVDGLQDPGNMGTLLRTADWFGIRQVVCSPDTVSCFNPKVVQASMGAIFRTQIANCSLPAYLKEARNLGLPIYGAMLDGEDVYHSVLERPALLVIGNEGRGLSPDVAAELTHRITIPNRGGTCESLNAALATAILCSEFYR